jgi:hypothetical protein
MIPLIPMRKALANPDIFGHVFCGESWNAWRALLIAAMGEKLTPKERVTFQQLTGRDIEPGTCADELWCVIGRRGGKTRAVAILAVYIAALCSWIHVLAPGERASLPILSATVWQSRKAFQYISGIFANVPALKKLVLRETADTISLSTGVDIESRPASFRTIRGGTCCACLCDEIAFWRSDESANPDAEILQAIRPSLATTGGPLIAISSPYARKGELYTTWKAHKGPNGDPAIIVAQAATRTMNPSLSQKVIDRAFDRDPIAAASEYGRENVEFRSDVESYITREVVEAVTMKGLFEQPPINGTIYEAFVDPSGGRGDDMTLAIAHREGNMAILDVLRCAKPPFDPDEVCKEFARAIRPYNLVTVRGDRYAGTWPASRFAAHGVTYEPVERTKSEIYQQALPLLMSRRVELLDNPKLINQLIGLERKPTRIGREVIDHAVGAHDDLCNAALGALTFASGWSGDFDLSTWLHASAVEGTDAWKWVNEKYPREKI